MNLKQAHINLFRKLFNMDPKIPAEYQSLMPYLIIEQADQFFDFVAVVFDAKELKRVKRDDGTLMHGEVSIGGSTVMFANASDNYSVENAGIFVYVDNADERFKAALSKGAIVINEPSDQSYGRSCGVKDPFGNTWWITSVIES